MTFNRSYRRLAGRFAVPSHLLSSPVLRSHSLVAVSTVGVHEGCPTWVASTLTVVEVVSQY